MNTSSKKRRTFFRSLTALLGAFIQAFGVYNIHSISVVKEGGCLGLELLAQHWLGISPAFTSLVLTVLFYSMGWKTFGKPFLYYSALSAGGYSLFYRLLEHGPRAWPGIAGHPLLAAMAGAAFIGVGAGLCVCAGGATAGDDALAMTLNRRYGIRIRYVYIAMDVVVLGASLSYVPLGQICYSILTVILSGLIVDKLQRRWSMVPELPEAGGAPTEPRS